MLHHCVAIIIIVIRWVILLRKLLFFNYREKKEAELHVQAQINLISRMRKNQVSEHNVQYDIMFMKFEYMQINTLCCLWISFQGINILKKAWNVKIPIVYLWKKKKKQENGKTKQKWDREVVSMEFQIILYVTLVFLSQLVRTRMFSLIYYL